MTTARISLLLLLVLAACPGGGGGGDPDARDPDARAPDASVDAVPGGAVLQVLEDLTAWDFGDVAVDQQSVALALTITNAGPGASGTLAVTLTGPDAAAFVLDPTTDCDGGIVLAPGANCAVRVRFAPTALGARTATLTIDAGGGAQVAVALTGTGVASMVDISPAPVAIGAVHAGGAGATAVATVSNTGTAAAAITSVTVTGAAFTLDATTCGATLAAGTTCTATVRFAPTAIGAASGDLAIVTDRGTATAALSGTGTGAINVSKSSVSGGTGTITSAPAGIACGATCSGLFGEMVVLTAEPDANTTFTGWSGACTGTGPCVLQPTVADQTATATFTGQRVLTIAAAGAATGAVYVDGVVCALPCTRAVSVGTAVHLDAISPSAFTGWSGACTGADMACDVTVNANVTATATFALDPGELWAATIPGAALERTAIASDGAILVAGHDAATHELVVARYTTAGVRSWLVRFQSVAFGSTVGMVADGAGGAVVLDYQPITPGAFANVTVRDVSATGTTTWSDSVPTARWYGASFAKLGDAAHATAAGGVVIALETATGGLVRSYDAIGTALWSATTTAAPYDVAVSSTGVVHVLIEDGGTYKTLARWSSAGAAQTNLVVQSPGSNGTFYDTLAIDASDRLLMTAVPSPDTYALRAISLAGATAWTTPEASRYDGAGVVALPGAGALVLAVYGTTPSTFALAKYASTGSQTWERTVFRPGSATTTAIDALFARSTAGNAAGNAVVVGDWMTAPAGGATSHDGFVRYYAP
ncbi:MAG: choice-of-anchor D domain-containing protein [Deltaproteobacteria bacterium]|nr:choice-of-anchor D domain-containing protein [Deltaproteobacteria bacterium]